MKQRFFINNTYYLLLPFIFLILIFIFKRLIDSPASLSVSEITPPILIFGVLIAYINFLIDHKRLASKNYLDGANDLLFKAYDVFSSNLDEHGRPLNSRINWLTTARLIESSKEISSLISEESHIHLWKANEEYWRRKFADLILPENDELPQEYFATSPEIFMTWGSKDRPPLSEISIAYLYNFVKWKGSDPLKDYPRFSSEEIRHMITFGPTGLGNLIKQAREIESGERTFDTTKIN